MQYFKPFKGFLIITIWVIGCWCTSKSYAQTKDTLPGSSHPVTKNPQVDTLPKVNRTPRATTDGQPEADSILQNALRPTVKEDYRKTHTAKGATFRSLVLPGWGQAYNHEYWKVPLAVAAVGIPIYLFIDNNREYKSARFAYSTVFEEMPIIDGGKGKLNPAKFSEMAPKFQDAYNAAKANGGNYTRNFLSSVQNYRNTFRQYRDYSIVAALIGWGLNIADATVFGHLRGFDVGPDLSMKIRPVYLQYARAPGISLSIGFR